MKLRLNRSMSGHRRRDLNTYYVMRRFLAKRFYCTIDTFSNFAPENMQRLHFGSNARIAAKDEDQYRSYRANPNALNFAHAAANGMLTNIPDDMLQDIYEQQRLLKAEGFIKITKKLVKYTLPPNRNTNSLIVRQGQLLSPRSFYYYIRKNSSGIGDLCESTYRNFNEIFHGCDKLLEDRDTAHKFYRTVIQAMTPYLTLNQILNSCNGVHPTT